MFCLAFLFVWSVLASAAFADEVRGAKSDSADEKFFFGGSRAGAYAGAFAVSYWGGGYALPAAYGWVRTYGDVGAIGIINRGYPRIWFKEAADSASSGSTARRALRRAPIPPPRASADTVQCKDSSGHIDTFVVSECLKAVESLVTKHVSSASCGTCGVKMVTPQGPIVPSKAPVAELQKLATQTLQSCGQASAHARRSPAEEAPATGNLQVAMIFFKGDGQACA